MTVDFADHFWGEKNNGFSVLYQNMKHGQANVKELVSFLRERAAAEEEYQKRLTLITKQVSTFGTVGTFSPVWQMVRASLDKISTLHSHLVQKLHDLSKEVQKYGDDQQKQHKEVKDKESKTFDAVNYIQTTTTCLQKARENYFARCIENEKLKRENAHAKEISKSETRMKKAAEEYKMYVDKYGKVRDDFEDRMIKAARSFQQAEENHLSQMKLFASAYAQNIQGSYVLVNQVYGDFLDQMTALDIDLLLQEFVVKKDTGTEKPLFYFFEEPDLSFLPHQPQSVPGTTTLEVGASLMGSETVGSTGAASSAESSPIPGGGSGGGTRAVTPPNMADIFFNANSTVVSSNQTAASTQHQHQQQQQKKLSLWLPGRNRKANSASVLKSGNSGGGSTTITPSPSIDMTFGANYFVGTGTTAPSALDGGKLEGDLGPGHKNSTTSSTASSTTRHQSLSAAQSASSYSTVPATATAALSDQCGPGPASATLPSSSYTLFGSFPPNVDEAKQAAVTAQQKRRERSLSMGFLRKKKEKKKKDKEVDNRSVQSSEDTKSKTSAESAEGNSGVVVDRDSIIPESHHNRLQDKDGSSSDSESEDEQPQKIKVEIKPLSQDVLRKSSASIDELRDAIGHMSCSNSGNTLKGWSSSTARRSGENVSMDFFDPMSARNHNAFSCNTTDPWRAGIGGNRTDVKLLRPAKTGDDRFNNRSFAGGVHFAADSFNAPMLPPKHAPPPIPAQSAGADPWPIMDESRDQLSDLSSTSSLQHSASGQWPGVTSATAAARSRPRSTTPTHMITLANASSVKRGSAVSRSSTTHFNEMTLTQSESVGSLDQHQTPSSLTSSRGPSPLAAIGPSDVVPLAMALTETVHVLFKGAGESRCVARVYGNVAVSFPSGIVNALAASLFSPSCGGQRPPLAFQLTNAEKIAALVPNRQVLNQGSTFQAGPTHQFECNMPALIAHLKRQADASPSAAFCNLDLVRYELKSIDASAPTGVPANSHNSNSNNGLKSVPLMLQSFWKCEPDHTDIRVDYQYNSQCAISAPLLNLTFSSQVNGGVAQVNSKPEAAWTSSNNRLSWRLTELSRHGDCSGSLKARLNLSSGPSTPAPTTVQFQINEHTLSGADLQLCNSGEDGGAAYRLSLLKKKTVSGKYLCESEVR